MVAHDQLHSPSAEQRSLTRALAGVRLGLDDPVGKYLPTLSGFGAGVTLRRLLNHTSGIRDFYDEAGIDEVLARSERKNTEHAAKSVLLKVVK